ncbi:MAG: sigma-70 family RNA polymerase sigma factor [Lentisphaerae bacterium]|nr:sigma-70 family RNA polymerase sigma factor [Lentisphaerota bacterium]MBT4821513.1 sigma-70 family RNA polymerase sigma factor [Lentisphaerota bacterium]MBT5610258.1 sigma-70 family RNA polymerase sigma factor [Lentisphaerota bacterium]MBT7055727.1 sigma-70 family RNA polymerase sigma factor [Lentisphaerota bacterium]MBT7846022.1 sigma-70 family RNA polymerase sigma factor [Lentisphaerota bacterium]
MDQIQDWIRSTEAGNAPPFDDLVTAMRRRTVALAYTRLGDYHLAQDAAQMAFIAAFRNLTNLRDTRAFGAWLRRITISQCNRIARARKRHEEPIDKALGLSSSDHDPRVTCEQSDCLKWLREEVQRLPAHQQVVVELYYVVEQSTARIAATLGLPVTTVKKRLHDARRNLRRRMLKNASTETARRTT